MFIRFEWDDAKAKQNLRKHGVAFDDAIVVFSDPYALTTQDRIEGGEQRWQTLGTVGGYLVLLVAHTVSDADDGTEIIRIISARAADRKERKRYEDQNR
jgi:uncharacterized DUF497 family protein